MNKAFYGGKGNIDLKVQIIKESKKADIIWQYIEFTKIVDKMRKKNKNKNKETFAIEVIDECIKKNVLKEFFIKYREEAVDMLAPLYDQETVTEYWLNEEMSNAREQGIAEGMQKAIVNLLKKGIISEADAAKEMGMSKKKLHNK